MTSILRSLSVLMAIVILLSACRKDTATSKYDFRDALVGTYTCTIHQWQYAELGFPPSYTTTYRDSLIGTDTLVVTKLSTDTTSVMVKGRLYTTINKSDPSAIIRFKTVPTSYSLVFIPTKTASSSAISFPTIPTSTPTEYPIAVKKYTDQISLRFEFQFGRLKGLNY